MVPFLGSFLQVVEAWLVNQPKRESQASAGYYESSPGPKPLERPKSRAQRLLQKYWRTCYECNHMLGCLPEAVALNAERGTDEAVLLKRFLRENRVALGDLTYACEWPPKTTRPCIASN